MKKWQQDFEPLKVVLVDEKKATEPYTGKYKKKLPLATQRVCEKCGNLIATNGYCDFCGTQNTTDKRTILLVTESNKKTHRQEQKDLAIASLKEMLQKENNPLEKAKILIGLFKITRDRKYYDMVGKLPLSNEEMVTLLPLLRKGKA
jgi:RNA polymerase subunit RPABC4/transcription elongation factor Spt4